ncbi:MAG: fibronectin type III domain-containing protein, partial [archaeon]
LRKFIVTLIMLIFVTSICFAVPTVTNISSSSLDATYISGQAISIQVTFSEAVNVSDGTPTLALNSGGSASYISGTGTATLDFNYLVASGQNTTDLNYSSTSALSAGGATIVSASDLNSANLDLTSATSLGTNKAILIDTSGPVCTVTSPPDGNYYNSTDLQALVFHYSCTDSISSVGASKAKLDGSEIPEAYALSGASEGLHTITIDANDTLGNQSTQLSSYFTVDTNSPSAGTITGPAWNSSGKPTLSISATHLTGTTGLSMRFSCNHSSWTSWVLYAATYSDFNIITTSNGCSVSDGNRLVYVQFKDGAGNTDTNYYGTTIGVDTVSPSRPTGLSAAAGNGSVVLSWTAPTADDASGNNSIEIYRNSSLIETVSDSNTTYTATGLTNGTSYSFKIRTIDKAGNYSDFTSEVSTTPNATTSSLTVKKSGSTIAYAKKGDVLDIACIFTDSVTNSKIWYAYSNPSASNTTLVTNSSSASSISSSFTISDSNTYGIVGFWCASNNTNDSEKNSVTLDNTAPTISWDDTNNLFVGARRIIVSATDNKAFDKVQFDFNSIISTASKVSSENKYYIDINSLIYANKDYSIKATAFDLAGNITEITRTITVANILSEQQKAQKAISDALQKKQSADDIVNYYKKEALLLPIDLNTTKQNTDLLLSGAQSDFLAKLFDTTLQKAESASASYTAFIGLATISTIDTNTYVFDSNAFPSILAKLGFSSADANAQAIVLANSNMERSITIVKAGSDSMRQFKIKITFTNDTNSDIVKIVEIIPKQFIDSADKIISDSNFRIVKNDPVIEFTVTVAKGARASITYGIGEVPVAKANEMLQNNVIALFSAPPLILGDNITAEELNTGGSFDFNLGGFGIIIILVILALIVVIVVILFFKGKQGGHGFGEKTNIASTILQKKEEPETKKWGQK